MSFVNFSDLSAGLADWLDRDDLTARIPVFIKLTESRLNRLLSDPEMEVRSDAVATGDYTALPDDFGEMVSISTGDGRLSPVGSVEFATFDSSVSGIPRYYSIVDNSIAFYPANGTANISMVYRRRIPPLTADSPTNWLMTLAPDLYFYGCLLHAYGWDSDDERIAGWKSMWDEAIGEMLTYGSKRKWGSGTLAPRIRRA